MKNEAKNSSGRISYRRVLELREQHGTGVRDLANQLLEDPLAADDVMRVAFLKLRRMKESDLPSDEKLPGMLADIVVRICLRRTGCVGCTEEAFRENEPRRFTRRRTKLVAEELIPQLRAANDARHNGRVSR